MSKLLTAEMVRRARVLEETVRQAREVAENGGDVDAVIRDGVDPMPVVETMSDTDCDTLAASIACAMQRIKDEPPTGGFTPRTGPSVVGPARFDKEG